MINAIWIPLTKDMYTLIDKDDYCLVEKKKWCCVYRGKAKTPCAMASPSKRMPYCYLHRAIMKPPSDMVVDHINGDGLDNRRCNLRICTQSQNTMNRHQEKKWKGISYRKDNQIWRAYIQINKKMLGLGHYNKALDAATAYNIAAIKYFGEFACLNDLTLSPPLSD